MITGIKTQNFNTFYAQNRKLYHEDYSQLFDSLTEHDIKYDSDTLWCEITPIILSAAERVKIISASEAVLAAAERFTDIVINSPEWQSRYDWSEEFWKLVKVDPGYTHSIPCSRFDSFLNGTELTFIELNTDGCSGMTNADTFHSLYYQALASRSELKLNDYTHDRAVPQVLSTLLSCYSEFRQNTHSRLPEKPVIGILDWAGESTNWEFTAFERYCKDAGYEACVVTPEQAQYRDDALYFDDKQVHVIYRRLLGEDYADNLALLQPVSDAYSDHAVCMVGPLRSQVAFSKKLFAFLHEPEVRGQLPRELADAVTAHVPWTRELRQMETEFNGKRIDLLSFIKEYKNHFVIKPCISKCGYGIYQGKYTDQAEWQEAVEAGMMKDYIVQEFVTIPEAVYPRMTPERENEKRYIHLGEYVFGGEFCGILGRTCADPLLNLRHGERLLAVLYGRSTETAE